MIENYTIFDGIIDLLGLSPAFLVGIFILGILLFFMYTKNNGVAEVRIAIASFCLYYYLCILFQNVVGIPTVDEFTRQINLGYGLFHPSFNLIPFNEGISFGFIMNIFIFVPIGFLVPLISKSYERLSRVIFLGTGLTLLIEISQMFTLYRISDIDDIITNIFGTLLGYLLFYFFAKHKWVKMYSSSKLTTKNNGFRLLPIIIIILSFSMMFFA